MTELLRMPTSPLPCNSVQISFPASWERAMFDEVMNETTFGLLFMSAAVELTMSTGMWALLAWASSELKVLPDPSADRTMPETFLASRSSNNGTWLV